MKASQLEIINDLRDEGYLVVIWTPGELGGVDVSHVEDRIIELGNEVIENLSL